MLHSKSIKFVHPITKEELYFESNPPEEFEEIVNMFKNGEMKERGHICKTPKEAATIIEQDEDTMVT